MKHKITISGIIGWDVIAQDIKDQFKEFKPKDEIEIEVNSPGGSVFEGIEISNAIKSHPGPTTTIATSLTASMGSYIMMSGDTKKAFDDATFMIHNVSSIGFGDHKALRKTANIIESLTNVLSKAYVTQTGKEKSEIRALMDEETWLFGDEILNAGFVDEIIKTEKPESKEEAVAFQKLVFEDCNKKISESENNKEDLEKLAAYFKTETSNGGTLVASAETPKDLPETPTTKEEDMNLKEYLAQNPEAKVELNNMIADAKTEGAEEKVKVLRALAEEVKPIISSDNYKKRIKTAGFEVLTGERTKQSFLDMVAVVDEDNEANKSEKIKAEQPDATPGEEHKIDNADSLKSPKLAASITDLKKNLNL